MNKDPASSIRVGTLASIINDLSDSVQNDGVWHYATFMTSRGLSVLVIVGTPPVMSIITEEMAAQHAADYTLVRGH